ncbi:MAG: EFR1 family ferrodoxin [Clostridia bacterium]|nr:EFR1 family ferrodoxin [Clostridia bacterium]
MILYFSATGNCKYVAERIAERLGDRAVSIEKSDSRIVLEDGETLGIVTPVTWWELPVIVREYLEKVRIVCDYTPYSFIVTTYGTTPGCTYAEARKILAEKDFALFAGFSVKMPDNYTPIFDVSDTDKVKKQLAEAEVAIEGVILKIKNKFTGNHMKRKTPYCGRIITKPMLERARKTEKFYVENTCKGCGLCAKMCPAEAIEITDGHPVWAKDRCTLCLRCLHSCPRFAIQYGNGKTKLHGQYKNPNTNI